VLLREPPIVAGDADLARGRAFGYKKTSNRPRSVKE
jgi:hypothetical protein